LTRYCIEITREIASYSIDATPSPRHHRRNCLLLASHGGGIAVLGVRIKTPFLYPKSSNPLKWLPLRHPKSGNPLKWLPLRHPKSGNPLKWLPLRHPKSGNPLL
jgi:hypothetical protein